MGAAFGGFLTLEDGTVGLSRVTGAVSFIDRSKVLWNPLLHIAWADRPQRVPLACI
jgi:hypothetical protein